MSFLTPLFLLGGLAVALPVLFHLIRRSTRERKPFSSLMFLMASPPRLTRRSRLEHLLLLALRALALCLLAAGFARPFLKKPVLDLPAADAPRRIAILVDTSASMRRANLWSDARARVEAFLARTSPQDQAALFTFDRQFRPLMTFEQWNGTPAEQRAALAAHKLAELSPGWSSTHLGNALIAAAESLAEPTAGAAAGGARQVLLVTDLQEGSRLDQLQGYEWPKGIQLLVETVKPRSHGNASIQLITDTDEADPKAAASVRVRVTNSAESQREQFRVGWAAAEGNAFAGPASEIYVPAGQSRVVSLPPPQLSPAGVPAPARILLEGDEEPFDNSVFVIPPAALRLNVLYFGKDSEQDPHEPRFFLQRAFQETRREAVRVTNAGSSPTPEELKEAGLLVVADSLPDAQARLLHEGVAAGQTLLFLLKDVSNGPTLARVLGVERLELSEGIVANYAMLGQIDFRHPLFADFADPRYSDFTRIHFWKYRKIDDNGIPGARILARFDNGDPAVVEVPVGRGRLFVLASGWQPRDSQLALSTKFVPLIHGFLELAGHSSPPPTQYHIDDVIAFSSQPGDQKPSNVTIPDGTRLALSGFQTNFAKTSMPGVYRLDSAAGSRQFAVNLDPAESRTTPLPADELERLGAPIVAQVSTSVETARQAQLHDSELESRQKLWRWLLGLTIAVLLVETWLSGRTARREVTSPAAG